MRDTEDGSTRRPKRLTKKDEQRAAGWIAYGAGRARADLPTAGHREGWDGAAAAMDAFLAGLRGGL